MQETGKTKPRESRRDMISITQIDNCENWGGHSILTICTQIFFSGISYTHMIQVRENHFFQSFSELSCGNQQRDQRERQSPLPETQHSRGNMQKESDVLMLSGNSGHIIWALALSHTDEIFLESNYVHCITFILISQHLNVSRSQEN